MRFTGTQYQRKEAFFRSLFSPYLFFSRRFRHG